MSFAQRHTRRFEHNRVLPGERGFTLVEVMAATVISLMVIGAGFTAVVTSQRALQVNDQVAQTQQNSRIALELLARDVKMAGFGMTGPVGACTIGGNPAPIVPQDNDITGADTGPDRVSLVVPRTNSNPTVGTVWSLRSAAMGPFTQIDLQQGVAPVDSAVTAMVMAGLGDGSTVSIGGAVSSTVAIGGIDQVNDRLTLTSQVGAPKVFPAGTQVFLLECVTYQVIGPGEPNAATCGASTPCLARGIADTSFPPTNLNCNTFPNSCVGVVDAVEDLQLAYACDGCNVNVNGGVPDGIPDDQPVLSGTFDINDFLADTDWTTPPLTPDKIRLVQVSVVARQERAEQGTVEGGSAAANSLPVIAGDHDPTTGIFTGGDYVPSAYATLRRRLLTRTIQTRNMGQ